MRNIYIKYLEKTNKADKKRKKIHLFILKLERELEISNEKKKQAVSFLEQ